MLLEGLTWRVGNGLNINAWTEPLAKDGVPIFPSPLQTSDMELRVADLINYENGEWDAEEVRGHFGLDDSKIILAIPLSQSWPRDRLVVLETSKERMLLG